MAETVASILKKKGDAIWSVEPTATVYEAIAMMAEKSPSGTTPARSFCSDDPQATHSFAKS